MKNWKIALAIVALILLASRGGLPAILAIGKVALPVVLFYFAVKHITLTLFPDRKKNERLNNRSVDENVIHICPECGKEERSCLKCKMGFKPKT